jgi:hypothetical protein
VSCSRSPSYPHVYTESSRRTYFVPPNLPRLPFNLHLPIKRFQTRPLRCHFRNPRSYSVVVPFCPYYCRSPTKLNHGLSRCPRIPPTVCDPYTYLCLFVVISRTVQLGCRSIAHGALPIPPEHFHLVCHTHRVPIKGSSYLGSFIWVSTTPVTPNDVASQALLFLPLQAVTNPFGIFVMSTLSTTTKVDPRPSRALVNFLYGRSDSEGEADASAKFLP